MTRCIVGILHDTIEDCEQSKTKTYREINEAFGLRVAEGVFCVSDELGRTRQEEKEKTYPKVKSNADSIFVKLADRITNVEISIKTNNKKMLKTYIDEHKELSDGIYNGDFEDMWKYLDDIVYNKACPLLGELIFRAEGRVAHDERCYSLLPSTVLDNTSLR